MTNISNKLREARALIERGWTQGQFACDADGDRVYMHSPNAVCYCATGAIIHAADPCGSNANYEIRRGAFDALGAVIEGGSCDEIEDWNDAPERTQADVLAAFDRAIELAEAQS